MLNYRTTHNALACYQMLSTFYSTVSPHRILHTSNRSDSNNSQNYWIHSLGDLFLNRLLKSPTGSRATTNAYTSSPNRTATNCKTSAASVPPTTRRTARAHQFTALLQNTPAPRIHLNTLTQIKCHRVPFTTFSAQNVYIVPLLSIVCAQRIL